MNKVVVGKQFFMGLLSFCIVLHLMLASVKLQLHCYLKVGSKISDTSWLLPVASSSFRSC